MSSKQIGSVYLNPRFKNIHINPKFIQAPAESQGRPNKIHVNPNFIKQNHIPEVQEKPLLCTRTKLIRSVNACPPSQVSTKPPVSGLKKIGLRKLVRTDLRAQVKVTDFPIVSRNSVTKFKLDRRLTKPSPVVDKRSNIISTRFRLKRLSTSDILSPRKVSVSRYRLRRIGATNKESSPSKKLLNINGVFYKSAQNTTRPSTSVSNSRGGNTLYIRGEKFLVTGNGNRLQRSTDSDKNTAEVGKRIDIGGCTFVATDKGTFERTNSHVVRNYISHAKQKSLHILTSHQFKKNNIPCMIYRRLGKCLSHERGKCTKVHNPDQVAVCKNFLKGKCTKPPGCLLSHKISMTKMPTCHFFLNGCCTTIDCPYLHKKINKKVDICPEFLKGFCALAEKCSKRHEFEEKDRKADRGTNSRKRSFRKHNQKEELMPAVDTERYYGKAKERDNESPIEIDNEDKSLEKEIESIETEDDPSTPLPKRRRRPPIGALPAFIPL